jgi:hypothetical protein
MVDPRILMLSSSPVPFREGRVVVDLVIEAVAGRRYRTGYWPGYDIVMDQLEFSRIADPVVPVVLDEVERNLDIETARDADTSVAVVVDPIVRMRRPTNRPRRRGGRA